LQQELVGHGVEMIVLAGYMRRIPDGLIACFPERILNIHPALLPDFGGPGMYGMHVHEAVIAAGARESGATVHLVDGEYDTGRIVAQRRLVVEPGETAETLAARVLTIEHELYPRAVIAWAGRIRTMRDAAV
ncbi:formyltransferase family protein, partial [Bradyrhizobium sp. NBAIM08]|uniref:formyltransferase family protein n=1 Tax=Bradyrhizobium sp. NBAIM08 TaxID=2793815 RepID=UPI0023EE725B